MIAEFGVFLFCISSIFALAAGYPILAGIIFFAGGLFAVMTT